MSKLTFHDAVIIATGCLDYGGGHHTDGKLDAFHHGIRTVINALNHAERDGFKNSQTAMLHHMGSNPEECHLPVHSTGYGIYREEVKDAEKRIEMLENFVAKIDGLPKLQLTPELHRELSDIVNGRI